MTLPGTRLVDEVAPATVIADSGEPIRELLQLVDDAADPHAREARAELLRQCGGDLGEYRRQVEALGLDWEAFADG